MRRRRDLDPFDRRGRDDTLGFDDVPLLFGRLVRRGRLGAAVTAGVGLTLTAGGAVGLWLLSQAELVYPFGWAAGIAGLGLGLWGAGQGAWFLLRPHPLSAIPDVRTFVAALVAAPHPVAVCTRCRRLLEVPNAKSCDRCLSAADVFTARTEADHRVIFATLPKDFKDPL